jgi:hypothetical protein
MSGIVTDDGRVLSLSEFRDISVSTVLTALRNTPLPAPGVAISCPCGRQIFDGRVIKARVVDVVSGLAKCRSCKSWVRVPIARNP